MFAQPPAKVLRKGRLFCTRVNSIFSALPVKVPAMFVLSPSEGNEPEYLVGMSPMASAATENVATTASDNRDLRILGFSNLPTISKSRYYVTQPLLPRQSSSSRLDLPASNLVGIG